MRLTLTATAVGDAVDELRQRSRLLGHLCGTVVGNFSFGFYFRVGQSIVAVGGPRLPPGPMHLVTEFAPTAPADQSIVCIGQDLLITEKCCLDLSGAICYRPDAPSQRQLEAMAPLIARFDHPDFFPGDIAHVLAAVRNAVYRADLHAVRTLLQGLGGGLTPTGDDVLAGILLFSQWTNPWASVPAEVASRAVTTDLSRSFLHWAALGQSIQPIHALIESAAQLGSQAHLSRAQTMRTKFELAVEAVSAIGGTSGRAMLIGLGLATGAWLARSSPQRKRVIPMPNNSCLNDA